MIVGTPVVLEWPLDLYKLFLSYRYKLDSPSFRGDFAEISAEVLVGFSRGRTHPGYGPVIVCLQINYGTRQRMQIISYTK